MDTSKFYELKEKLSKGWDFLVQKSDEDDIAGVGRERIIVFIVAFILAFFLWLMVNLSRDFNLNIELPIQLGAVPSDKALVEDLPETATVSVSGEGWQLINFYNNPPSIDIDVSDTEVNLHDQVQQQMNALPNVDLQKVQPLILTVELEDRISKKVPIRPNVEVSFERQYGFVDSAEIKPGNVNITGAASLLREINEWPTDSIQINNVSGDLSRAIPLQEPGELIQLSQNEVMYNAEVTQYTEGEAKVNISTRNFPQGRMVSFSPLSITVKFDIPIDEYPKVTDEELFNAFVTYSQIIEDSSGFVTPQIEQSTDDYHIKIRSFQPRRVAYFMILGDQQ
jgi:YbbR domain-containing protein